MKFIMSLLAVTALSFVTSAFAQEESPSATPEENSSTTVEEKPSTTISEEPKAQKKEETAAQKKEELAAQKKAQPAAQKKEVMATAVASAPGKKMSPDAALRDMENRWEGAIGKHDAATVEAMVADDFVGVSSKPGAKVQNRRAMLANMKADKDTYTSAKNEKLDVRMFGNAAVVVGTAREKGTGKDGKAFDRSYRFTDTWVDRAGKWQCVASQASLVSGK